MGDQATRWQVEGHWLEWIRPWMLRSGRVLVHAGMDLGCHGCVHTFFVQYRVCTWLKLPCRKGGEAARRGHLPLSFGVGIWLRESGRLSASDEGVIGA